MLSPRLTSVGLLLIFLAGVMCLCGAVGYQHLADPGPAVPLEAQQAGAQADQHEGRSWGHGTATIAYTATLVLASMGAALYLVLGRSRHLSLSSTGQASRRPTPRAAPLIVRSPARTQLQVFLL